MDKLFDAIRKNDKEEVKELISKNVEIVNEPYQGQRKKDNGQSPLMAALKTGRLSIANYLIDHGADVNYIDKDSINEWKAPVIQDAVRCAVFSSRHFFVYKPDGKIEQHNSKERSDFAFNILNKMIEKGADVTIKDSYQNTCLDIFELSCKSILPSDESILDTEDNGKKLITDTKEDLTRIMKLLIDNGCDINIKNHNTNKSFKEEVETSILGKVLTI